jgi:hypothetical protein
MGSVAVGVEETAMGNKTRVQSSERKGREHWSVCVPSAVAQAMEFMAGETVEWVVVDRDTLVLRRVDETFPTVKKNGATITRLF